MKYTKSIVAAGHDEVCRAAAIVLEAGGNAFDAVVAAGFASTVVEPALTSLGGGGFMLGHDAGRRQDIFFDFFVDTPGMGREGSQQEPHFFPVTVNFSGASQVFNVGLGSVAVPGTLRGLLHIQSRLGRMGLAEVLEPARALARSHLLNEQQAHFLKLLKPIMTLHEEGVALYEPAGKYVQAGDALVNRNLASFLDQLAYEGDDSFYHGEIAARIVADMQAGDGLVTSQDLAGYKVIERPPLRVRYHGAEFLTAPEPSMGGTLIGLSLTLAERSCSADCEWGSPEQLLQLTRRMQEVERYRAVGVTSPAALSAFAAGKEFVAASPGGPLFPRGTTHISIADYDGNCASMTCSNGEGSGYIVPGTGIMLNNMMGEDDLHPDGFHESPPGQRVLSMMSPSLLVKNDEVLLVIGSGGSKRIRTAITQVLSQIVDYGREVGEAVGSPRLYWDEDRLQVEPGFPAETIEILRQYEQVRVWDRKDVYFGGVHCVVPGKAGAGDPRRGGAVAEVYGD